MKKILFLTSVAVGLLACNNNKKTYTTKDLKDITDSASYVSGILTGQQMKADTLYKINMEIYLAAIREGFLKDSNFAIDPKDGQAIFQKFSQKVEEKQLKGGQEFLSQIESTKKVTKLDGGILVETLSAGEGELIGLMDSVSFQMKLKPHTKSDNAVDTENQSGFPVPFVKVMDLGQEMFEGMPLAFSKLQAGGTYNIYIPYTIAQPRGSSPGDVSIITVSSIKVKK